jgi:hypothetical protein
MKKTTMENTILNTPEINHTNILKTRTAIMIATIIAIIVLNNCILVPQNLKYIFFKIRINRKISAISIN